MQAYAEPETSPDEAFEQLYRLYVNDVYRYALALLHNPSDAEDVTQTTFLNAYRAFKRGEDPRKPQHWLIKIAHNACRSRYVRMARRPREVPLDESIARLPMPADDAIDVRELLAALGELPFNQRAALVMRELEDRSYRDIADTLGVTVPAVETLIFRARRRMRAERAALQALGAVQLPQSLASFFEGGGAIAGGGAAVGSGGLALKAVLMLAAGAVAGSVGYKTVTATAFPLRPSHQTAVAESARPPAGALPPAGTAFYASSTRVRVTSRVGSRAAGRFASVGSGSPTPGALHVGASRGGAFVDISKPGSPPRDEAPATSAAAPVDPVSGSRSAGGTSAGSLTAPGGVSAPSPPPDPVSTVTTAVSDPPSAPSLPAPSLPAAPALPAVPTVPALPDPVAALVPPPPPLPHVP